MTKKYFFYVIKNKIIFIEILFYDCVYAKIKKFK